MVNPVNNSDLYSNESEFISIISGSSSSSSVGSTANSSSANPSVLPVLNDPNSYAVADSNNQDDIKTDDLKRSIRKLKHHGGGGGKEEILLQQIQQQQQQQTNNIDKVS